MAVSGPNFLWWAMQLVVTGGVEKKKALQLNCVQQEQLRGLKVWVV